MRVSVKTDKLEAIGFVNVEGVTFDVEVSAEESITFLKQILPLAREVKNLRLFEVEKDNQGLCNSLNLARDEKRETEHELRQTRTSAELEKSKLNDKVKELEAKLAEAKAMAKIANK